MYHGQLEMVIQTKLHKNNFKQICYHMYVLNTMVLTEAQTVQVTGLFSLINFKLTQKVSLLFKIQIQNAMHDQNNNIQLIKVKNVSMNKNERLILKVLDQFLNKFIYRNI